jgi:hypothetical protein
MSDAKLREQRVNGAGLHTRPPAAITQLRRFNVILSIRNQ